MKNKNIIITGGTSGIGLELSKQLGENNVIHNISRKNNFDLSSEIGIKNALKEIKKIKPEFLFLNAGMGLFSKYHKITFKELTNLMNINLNSNIWIISQLYKEIEEGLKIIITLSTASYINGAYEAVYNSSKKALKEYIISVNTELKDQSIDNQIFMFVPHKVENTLMTNTENKPSEELKLMIEELISSIDQNLEIFIPKYKDIFENVFKEYREDPYKQGKRSIEYKRRKNE